MSRVNDYYNGLDIIITGGTGIGQIRRISDYNGSTRVATPSPDFTTAPASDSTYSLLMPIPDSFHYLSSMYASIRGFIKDEANKKQIQEEFDRLLIQFIQSIEHRQNQESRGVNYIEDEQIIV